MSKQHHAIKFPGRLESLVAACGTLCVPQCCGMEAFDFSPIHAASHLARYTGSVAASDVNAITKELDSVLETAARNQQPGMVFSIESMNQILTLSELEELIARIKRSVHLAIDVHRYAESLLID